MGDERRVKVAPDFVEKYAVAAIVSFPNDGSVFIIDFLKPRISIAVDEQGRVKRVHGELELVARIVLPPIVCKRFLAALQSTVRKYESAFGEIAVKEEAPPEEAPPSPPPFIDVPPSAVTETPEWLPEITLEKAAAPEAEITETPEWLAESQAGSDLLPAAVISAFESATAPRPPQPGIEVTEPVVSPAEPAGALAQAEIPDWLQAIRPRPEVAKAAVEEEPVETKGPLQGLRSLLPPAMAIETPAVRESVLPAEVSEASLARAQLLQGLLTQPAQAPRPEERKRGISMGERAQRWLVAVVLLVAVLGILIPPLMGFDVPTLTQPATFPSAIGRIEFQHVMNLHTAVQSTSTGDTALVAFEYGPPEADELDLVAEPILRHLLDQGAHISIVSTQPEGLAVAAGLLSDIAAPEAQYTLASYRPGDATAVSSLLIGADIPPGGESEGSTHPKLIVVLTARPAPLRWWVEQARALGDTPPVVAGVSASLQIAASPYLDANAGQLEGAISGLSGAAAYEAHRGLGGWATQRLNALAAGHIAVVGLMILGAIVCTFGGLRGRKK